MHIHACEDHGVHGKQERGILEAEAAPSHRKKMRSPVTVNVNMAEG